MSEFMTQAEIDSRFSHLAMLERVNAELLKELLGRLGPCSNALCRLHYAHNGPCYTGNEGDAR